MVTKEEVKEPAKWTPPKCIIVPVVLKMADVDHQVLDMATILKFSFNHQRAISNPSLNWHSGNSPLTVMQIVSSMLQIGSAPISAKIQGRNVASQYTVYFWISSSKPCT